MLTGLSRIWAEANTAFFFLSVFLGGFFSVPIQLDEFTYIYLSLCTHKKAYFVTGLEQYDYARCTAVNSLCRVSLIVSEL